MSSTGARTAAADHREFGGPLGAALIMTASHLLMLYLWMSWRFHGGAVFIPTDLTAALAEAIPTWSVLLGYWAFLVVQGILYVVLPGPRVRGKAVPSQGGARLVYHCNGIWAWYSTLAIAALLHFCGLFPLQLLYEHFGAVMVAAILTANLVAVVTYVLAHTTRNTHRMSGNHLYDFFMGAWLNPRIGRLDLKMWAEIRVSWLTLFLLTASAAAHQWAQYGTLSTPMIFMLVAHGLYTNACMKGEECVPTTWDIFHEKWGWMLIFWNLAGVPFVYCFNAMYIASRAPFEHHPAYTMMCFVLLLAGYYIWDTAQSQRNRFRMQLAGTYIRRRAFPQLPWGTLKGPRYLDTRVGSKLLVDGWWRYARKIHYTADVMMGLSWGLICGFDHFLPYAYITFFLAMILHRAGRDVHRCRAKYGRDWDRYCRVVPYQFIPGVY